MVQVILPAVLLRLFPGAPRALLVEAATVAAALDALDRNWPGMKDRLCDSTPRIRRHVNIFIGAERASLDTPIPDGAKLLVMTAITGG